MSESLVESFHKDMNDYNNLSELYYLCEYYLLNIIIELYFDGVPSVGRSMSNPELNGIFKAANW